MSTEEKPSHFPNLSLSEIHSTMPIPSKKGFWRKFFAYSGPGFLVSVGYMDPGNWATDLQAGAQFGYGLLTAVLASNIMAVILQHMALKLGVVSGGDLAQNCRKRYSKVSNFCLWVLCELAIIATDLAEVIGSAIALNLLFGIPYIWGAIITVLDVFIILYFQSKGFRWIESIVLSLIVLIIGCFVFELIVSAPYFPDIIRGYLPKAEIVSNPSQLYLAIGILGATVMPHNLYLHSSIVLSRKIERTEPKLKEAIKYFTLDSTFALTIAFFVNSAILILSAATFHNTVNSNIAEIQDAYYLLSPVLGVSLASTVFAVALLASGQNSTLTGTLAGQIVIEGFLNIKLPPWIRRVITRTLAIIPVLFVLIIFGEKSLTDLLILSQVVLSMQLPFAIVPLVSMTNDKILMGRFKNGPWLKWSAYFISSLIIVLNVVLLYQLFFS